MVMFERERKCFKNNNIFIRIIFLYQHGADLNLAINSIKSAFEDRVIQGPSGVGGSFISFFFFFDERVTLNSRHTNIQ